MVGPTQSGKTLSASVIPTLYQLFECGDDVVFGAPTIEMAKDKWTKDFSPVIQRTRYKNLMPARGTGARGGTPTGIDFLNGASLRFMTGGASDKGVAGYTARVIAVTEVDGMDDAMSTSREADRISQLEVRGDAFGLSKRVYLECTASIPEGRIWREYLSGTHTVIEKPCPYCGAWVVPEREHLRGWQECENERAVIESAYFACPACDHPLTPHDRVDMAHACRERVDNPDTLTYSFRWNAFDNLFWTPGECGLDEYRAAHRPEHERDDAEKVQHQFKWALPWTPKPPEEYITVETLEKAVHGWRRGIIPPWADTITTGTDVHKFVLYWVAVAWRKDGTGHIIDYGSTDCPSGDSGELRGIRIGLDTMHDFLKEGWPIEGTGEIKHKALSCIDAGYQQETVVEWCRKTGGYWPALGKGHTQTAFGAGGFKRLYAAPRAKSKSILDIGEQYHVVKLGNGAVVINHNVDWEKLWVQNKLKQPGNEPGALTLFTVADNREHLTFLKHLTAEQMVEENGETKWLATTKNNHYLDALCLAGLAARKMGISAVPDKANLKIPDRAQAQEAPRPQRTRIRTRY